MNWLIYGLNYEQLIGLQMFNCKNRLKKIIDCMYILKKNYVLLDKLLRRKINKVEYKSNVP